MRNVKTEKTRKKRVLIWWYEQCCKHIPHLAGCGYFRRKKELNSTSYIFLPLCRGPWKSGVHLVWLACSHIHSLFVFSLVFIRSFFYICFPQKHRVCFGWLIIFFPSLFIRCICHIYNHSQYQYVSQKGRMEKTPRDIFFCVQLWLVCFS